MIVVDASAVLARILPGQATRAADELLASRTSFVAPAIFAVELRNALLKAERRRLIGPAQSERALVFADALIETETPDFTTGGLTPVVGLARAERLSFYDAAYLDLAARKGAELASRDVSLLEAARRRGLIVHDLR